MSLTDGHTETERFVFFWRGCFSQWHRGGFVHEGVRYNTAEQGMMAAKARHFGDAATLAKILGTDSPKEQKAYGREVTPFDAGEWDRVSREYVYQINLSKFRQDGQLRAVLLATGDKIIVEASPVDRIWGIGLAADDPLAQDVRQWRGKNYLGECLMRVRATLAGETA